MLICCQRKILLAVGWWLMLIWYEKKILLAGWLTSQLNRAMHQAHAAGEFWKFFEVRSDLPIHCVRQIGTRDSSMVICELVSMNCDRSPFISSPCMEHGVWTLDCDPPRDWLYSRWSMAGTRLCFGGETEKGTGNHELNGCKGEKRTMMEWLTM